MHCRIDNEAIYHPEKIVWEPYLWKSIDDQLLDYLDMALHYYPTTIDEADLAMYFAHLLMDDAAKRYVKGAEDGILRIYDGKTKTRLMEPGSIDPTSISEQHDAFQ